MSTENKFINILFTNNYQQNKDNLSTSLSGRFILK